MKIENNGSDHLAHIGSKEARPIDKSSDDGSAQNLSAPQEKDKATLSTRAKLMAKARTSLDEVPEVRADRVDKLREQILDGSYELPYEQLADTLIKYLEIGD